MGPLNPRLVCQRILSFVYSVFVLLLPFFGIFRLKEESNLEKKDVIFGLEKKDEKDEKFNLGKKDEKNVNFILETKDVNFSLEKKDEENVNFKLEKKDVNFSLGKKDEKEVNLNLEKKEKDVVFVETEYKAVNDVDVGEFIRFDNEFEIEKQEETEETVETESSCLKFKFPSFDEFIKVQERPASLFTFGSSEDDECDENGKETVPSNLENLNLENDKVEEEGVVVDLEEKQETVQEEEEEEEEETAFETELGAEFDAELEHARSMINSLVDSCGDDDNEYSGFLADSDFGDSDIEDEMVEELSVHLSEESEQEEESGFEEELKALEEDDSFLCEKDFDKDFANVNDSEQNLGKLEAKDESLSDSDDALWEHQELIEQLKMELKKVRATGLPTILEESEESPKITEDLKPWRMNDEKFHREDCIGELHKFYKSYRERMRKFDILNYQKMYAMGVLQLKDPLQSMSSRKPTAPTLKSLVSQNLWLMKHKVHGSDPMKKFIEELQGDLEVIYVGHMCLSWEFLHWQHEKALDLWDSDPRGIHQYNEVAGEFQQFQVLMQRFVEDEPYQGPRVQSYVKSRCVLRNLLQVPVIREDKTRNKRKAMTKEIEEYVITSDMLVEIVEESIRIFWRFVRADKDCTAVSTSSTKKKPQLQNSEDAKLFSEVRKTLQKKERKLKDMLRSENCILRKFRSCREDESQETDHVLYFFSQVDMKLVCRVLNMSTITRDQLIWCQNKLNRIRFVNRKIHVEPGFLLFPC